MSTTSLLRQAANKWNETERTQNIRRHSRESSIKFIFTCSINSPKATKIRSFRTMTLITQPSSVSVRRSKENLRKCCWIIWLINNLEAVFSNTPCIVSMLSSLKTPRGEPRTDKSISPHFGSLVVLGVTPTDNLLLLTCSYIITKKLEFEKITTCAISIRRTRPFAPYN